EKLLIINLVPQLSFVLYAALAAWRAFCAFRLVFRPHFNLHFAHISLCISLAFRPALTSKTHS
ncbi:MAG: hypothetical protein KBB90_01745, partial [Spirochaetia bacterium]|nr:hypothetical protein [Spirochaetia bacterium]